MEEISIKISICDRVYPLRINAEIEENVRSAAKLANDKAKSYTERYSVKDNQDALAMASLDLATDFIAADNKSDNTSTQAQELLALINTTLDSKLNS